VGPFQEGLNVIHAPNATGKSTLFEAMRRGFLDGHRVGGKEVEVIRPWGRELAPTVTVEFSHGGQEYRITKRFLDSPPPGWRGKWTLRQPG
jgi:DNA repair exonuclease SbcCD ATPase subunit